MIPWDLGTVAFCEVYERPISREQFQAFTPDEKQAYRQLLWQESEMGNGIRIPQTQEEFDALPSLEEMFEKFRRSRDSRRDDG